MRRIALAVAAVGLCASLVGCSSPQTPAAVGGGTASVPSPTAAGTRIPPTDVPVPPAAGGWANAAKDDLAKRLGISRDLISITLVQAVQWPDAALGCPIPGRSYAQVVTPGHKLVLQANGQTFEYHTDNNRRMVSCQSKP